MTNKEYVLNKISSAEISNEPWKHVIINDFLPKQLYDGIKSETDLYLHRKQLKESAGKGARAYHINVNISQGVYPDKTIQPNLHEYYNILSDTEVETAIKSKNKEPFLLALSFPVAIS